MYATCMHVFLSVLVALGESVTVNYGRGAEERDVTTEQPMTSLSTGGNDVLTGQILLSRSTGGNDVTTEQTIMSLATDGSDVTTEQTMMSVLMNGNEMTTEQTTTSLSTDGNYMTTEQTMTSLYTDGNDMTTELTMTSENMAMQVGCHGTFNNKCYQYVTVCACCIRAYCQRANTAHTVVLKR